MPWGWETEEGLRGGRAPCEVSSAQGWEGAWTETRTWLQMLPGCLPSVLSEGPATSAHPGPRPAALTGCSFLLLNLPFQALSSAL